MSTDRIAGSDVDPSMLSAFFKLSADKLPVFKRWQAQVYFLKNSYGICCVYVTMAPHYKDFDSKLTSDAKVQLVI